MTSQTAGTIPAGRIVRFGAFEFRTYSRELLKRGLPLRLQEKPALVLQVLLRNPGQVVSRETLYRELWPSDTFVEYEAGLNTAVSKLRSTLGDSTSNPIFIERLPKQGYRFIAPVEVEGEVAVRTEAVETPLSEPPPPAQSWLQRHRLKVTLAAGVVFAVALVSFYLINRAARLTVAEPVHFTIRTAAERTIASEGQALALSADGSVLGYIGYVGGTSQIFARRVDESEFHPVPGSQGAYSVFFSPDGREVAFWSGKNLKRSTLNGGNSQILAASPEESSFLSGVWGEDGYIYFGNIRGNSPDAEPGSRAALLYRVRPGSPPELLTPDAPTEQRWYFPHQLLPGARDLLYSDCSGPRDRRVAALSLANSAKRTLADPGASGFYLASGHLVYSWKDSLMAAPFDLTQMHTTAPATIVIPNIAPRRWAGVQAVLSATGTVAWIPSPAGERELVWVDQMGHEENMDVPPGAYDVLSISPTGNRLLIARRENGFLVLWDYQIAQRKWTRIAAVDNDTTTAAWSPDEKAIAFTAAFQGEQFENLYLQTLGSLDPPRRIAPSPWGQFAQSWSRESGLIYTESDKPFTHIDLFSVVPGSNAKPAIAVSTIGDDSHGQLSPDGKWLVYASSLQGKQAVYVQPYPGPTQPMLVAENAGAPLWSPSGDEIFYRTPEGMGAAVFSRGAVGKVKELFHGKYTVPTVWNRRYLLSHDGKKFLMMRDIVDKDDYHLIHVVVNWSTELNRIMPGAR